MPCRNPKTGRFIKKPMSINSMPADFSVETSTSTSDPESRPQYKIEGRRIVELSALAENLSKCSGKSCDFSLDLRNIVGETRSGFASFLHIRCRCGIVNRVKTCKSHQSSRGRPVFDVNTVAAAAMIHAGMSQASLQKFSSSLDIHPPDKKTLKRREREIGPVLEKVARASCEEAIGLEKKLVGNENGNNIVEITAGYDMGWQRRSSGRSYNSKSGHGALIGEVGGLVLDYGTRISNCKQCEVDKSKVHDCRLNWGGSSKAMESDLAVSMLNSTSCDNHHISTIIGDDDCTTMAKIQKQVPYNVTKQSDINHAKKALGNDLYKLQKTHKILQHKVISYLQKCFSYAISQNKNDPEKTRSALLSIEPHVFGQHENCGTWCKFKSDPNHYYKHLPNKTHLTGIELRSKLKEIFLKQANNSAQLCFNATSNPNESFNTMVASKAPKSKHNSKSESLDYRVAAAVCQKNMGEGYLCIVNEVAGIPPGKVAVESSNRKQYAFRKRKIDSLSKKSKRRRLELKQSRFECASQLSLREGVTYQTSVSASPICDEDIEEIPPATFLPPIETVPIDRMRDAEICIFDLETTSLQRDCDIVQISAVTLDGRSKFNQYILPSKNIAPSASKVTGLTVNSGKLFLHGKPVSSVDVKEGLLLFQNWLSSFGKEIILMGHNIKAFDVKHLLRHSNIHRIDFPFLAGFIDTLPVFKSFHPGQSSYSQENLYRKIVGANYVAHNALTDVIALTSLINATISDISSLYPFTFSIEWFKSFVTFLEKRDRNLQTFQPLLESMSITKGMAEKAASTGLCYRYLQTAFRRQGELGIKALLGEQFAGTVRVTKNARVISSLLNYFNAEECNS